MPRKYDRDYDHESLRDEREYGFYWYSGLWRILRPVLVFLAALMIVFGAVSAIWDAVDEAFLSPIDPQDQTEIAFSVESGNSLTRVSNNLEKQGLIKNSTFFKYYCDFAGLGQKIQAGDYLIKKSMDVFEIADLLTTGDGHPLTMDITIIPGDTVENVAAYLKGPGVFTDETEFLNVERVAPDELERMVYAGEFQQSVHVMAFLMGIYTLESFVALFLYRSFLSFRRIINSSNISFLIV